MNHELVASCRAGTDGERHAIENDGIGNRARTGEAHRGTRVLAAHGIASAGASHHVVIRRDGAEVGARRGGERSTGIGRRVGDAHAADIEEVTAQCSREVHALAMLRVDLRGHGQGDASELVARGIQHFATPVEQAAQRAARNTARDVDRAAGGLQRELQARGIERILHRRDGGGRGAQHQRLTIADENVERGIALGHHGHAYLGGQLIDELIALIEQVVGRLSGLLDGHRDIAVQACHALRQHGDFAGLDGQPRIHVGGHFAQPRVVTLQAVDQRPALREQHLAGRNGARCAGDFVQRVGVTLHRGAETVGGIAEQIVETLGLRSEGFETCKRAAGAAGLLREKLVVHAPHLRRVDSAADPVGSIGLRRARFKFNALAGVTLRRDVCDVVGGRVQRALQGAQTRQTCPEHVSHCSSSSWVSAFRAPT